MNGYGIGELTGFVSLYPVEENPGRIGVIRVAVGKRSGPPRCIPFLAAGDAGMATDADVQIDHEGQLLGDGVGHFTSPLLAKYLRIFPVNMVIPGSGFMAGNCGAL